MGMDVLAWCALGIADVLIVHGGSSGFLMQQEVDVRWVSEAAFSSPNEHCWVYVSVGGVPCECRSNSCDHVRAACAGSCRWRGLA